MYILWTDCEELPQKLCWSRKFFISCCGTSFGLYLQFFTKVKNLYCCWIFVLKQISAWFISLFCWPIVPSSFWRRTDVSDHSNQEGLLSPLFIAAEAILSRFEPKVGYLEQVHIFLVPFLFVVFLIYLILLLNELSDQPCALSDSLVSLF